MIQNTDLMVKDIPRLLDVLNEALKSDGKNLQDYHSLSLYGPIVCVHSINKAADFSSTYAHVVVGIKERLLHVRAKHVAEITLRTPEGGVDGEYVQHRLTVLQ